MRTVARDCGRIKQMHVPSSGVTQATRTKGEGKKKASTDIQVHLPHMNNSFPFPFPPFPFPFSSFPSLLFPSVPFPSSLLWDISFCVVSWSFSSLQSCYICTAQWSKICFPRGTHDSSHTLMEWEFEQSKNNLWTLFWFLWHCFSWNLGVSL